MINIERITSNKSYNSSYCTGCRCYDSKCTAYKRENFIFCKTYHDNQNNAAWDKLKAYEDAEEAGKLVKLPCKPGDELYYEDEGEIQHEVIGKITSVALMYETPEDCLGYVELNDFGKWIFLTREEAEAQLVAFAKEVGNKQSTMAKA